MSVRGRLPHLWSGGLQGPLWTVAVLWASLAAACLYLVVAVDGVRGGLADGVSWLKSADRLYEALEALGRPEPPGATPAPLSALIEELEHQAIRRAAPVGDDALRAPLLRWEHAALRLLSELEQPAAAGRVPGAARLPASPHLPVLLAALSEVRADVRSRQGELTQRLSALWTRLAVLASACVVGVGLLSWLLLRHAAQTRALARSQADLAASEARFRTLVQTSQDLIWSVDTEGRWTFVNEAARRIYGYAPEELLGRPFVELLAAERVEPDLAVFAEILKGRTFRQHETVHMRKDGSPVRLLFHATVMRAADGSVLGTTGTAADVTAVSELQNHVRHADRLQALGTLAGGVAHDFNNLLTGVIGNAGFAREDQHDPERLAKDLEAIELIAQRGRTLTRQLLAFARKQVLQPETLDLCRVALEQQDFLRRLLGEEVTLRTETPGHPVWVRADRTQVEQVLMNLAVNSRDAMPAGKGRISIAVGTLEVGPAEAPRLGLTAGTWVRLDVEDDGEGMEEGVRQRLFEPFFTTKAGGKGTGLGLPTVYGIVHQHGGSITCDSTPGRGTLMRVLLPPCEAPAQVPAGPQADPVPVTGHGLRVLVVEDDPLVRDVVQRVLQGAGFHVLTSQDPAQALEALRDGQPALELLVTDVRMPGLSGPQLAARLRTLWPDLPVLFISGYAGRELPARWLDQVSTLFLRKPFTPLELLQAVGTLCQRPASVGAGRTRPR